MSIEKSGFRNRNGREQSPRPTPERVLTLRRVLPGPVAGTQTRWAWRNGVPAEQPAANGEERLAPRSVHIEIVVGPAQAARVVELLRQLLPTRPGPRTATAVEQTSTLPATHFFGLTPREEDVLEQMMEGKSNRQIALDLGIALATVKTHVSNVLSKMDAESRTEAVSMALQQPSPAGRWPNFCVEP